MNACLPKSALLPLAACLISVVSGCMSATVNDPDSEKSAGGSDEIDTRVAVDRTGKPVAAARIALVRADDSTGKPAAVSATGKDGTFPSFVVPDGLYSVVLRDAGDSLGKFMDSVAVRNQKLPAGRDTLLALGSVRGVVRVAAGHSPATVTVDLLGTDILANVKADGTFRIELVPGGLYTLGAFPSLDGYGPLYKRIQLKDGQDLTLPDTLVMPFTGLPSPGALRVLQDTGTGNVRLSWNRVGHPDLLGYVLERVEGGAVTLSRFLTDTTWTDSLGAIWEAMPLLGPWPSREVAYRVRSRSLVGSPDSKSVADAITAKPPEWTKRVDPTIAILSQDTSSGDVRIHWKAVHHPHLSGYVVERLENGNSVPLRWQRDTIVVDSIGQYWNALPLLGPWPVRSLSYRIRLVADSLATDAVTASADFQAKPPEWTKHVDSVKVTMTTDSVAGVTTLKWNTPTHPDLVGWSVTRSVDGVSDCTAQPTEGTWSDAGCQDLVWRPVASLPVGGVDSRINRLLASNKATISYSLTALRRSIAQERIGETVRQLQAQSLAIWRDSATSEDMSKTQFATFGGWISKLTTPGQSYALSKNGVDWEKIPHSFERIIGQGDSVWTVSLDPDSIHITVSSRVNTGSWSSRKIPLPVASPGLGNLSVKDGNLVVGFETHFGKNYTSMYVDTILELRGDSFVDAKIGGFGPFMIEYNDYSSIPISQELRVDRNYGPGGASFVVVQSGEVLITKDFLKWEFTDLVGVAGKVGGMILWSGADFAYLPVEGDARVIRAPGTVQEALVYGDIFHSCAVFQDEIWAIVDGHLWKGKLNLPK